MGETSLLPRVGMLLVTVGDLSGSGGTERQFADLFEYYRQQGSTRIDLITSSAGLERLRHTGRLASVDHVIPLALGPRPAHTKAGIVKLTAMLLWTTLRHRWDVVHICQPTPAYIPFAAVVSRLPKAWRPRIALTIVDCTLAHHLQSGQPPVDTYEREVLEAHQLYFDWTRMDGVFSWYKAFVEAASRLRLLRGSIVKSATYCFTNVNRFVPGPKRPLIVYAGRFSEQKRPLLFIDAVASLIRRHPGVAEGALFAMYGTGPLESASRDRIAQAHLEDRIAVTHTTDMAPVFGASKLFVSTQAFENFTSLAMLEAMAAGNAVVAEDVGQSREFVKPGINGYLVTPATADAFADAMADYLRRRELHDGMAAASRRIATDVHTIEHFAADIAQFWRELAA